VTATRCLVRLSAGWKASIRSPLMLARLAIIDPDLTLEVPATITATTGLDTLTQLIEPYVSSRANPFNRHVLLKRLARAIKALPAVYANGADTAARGYVFASLLRVCR